MVPFSPTYSAIFLVSPSLPSIPSIPREHILIFGGRGFIAAHLKTVFPDAILSEADITDTAAVGRELDSEKPDIVINAAGKTGKPNVDWCENHKLETVMSNVKGPLIILDACAKRGIYWAHIGSGCTYEGDNGGRGFTEEDTPNYSGSFYAKTKLWADQILKEFPVLQLRLRMPFDGSTHDRNLITKIKRYGRVLDEKNSLTYLPDFLLAAKTLIGKRATGIFNIVNPGTISPYDIMVKYKEIVDPKHTFEKLSMSQLSEVAKTGRSNCFLCSDKLKAAGVVMRPIEEAVDEALRMIAKA